MNDPHAHPRILQAGAPPEKATSVMLMFHGRGASADDILALAGQWLAPGMAFVAPEAAGNSWWPQRFVAPLHSNQPHIDSAMRMAAALLTSTGIPAARTLLLGFSQGACLAAEFAVRHPQRYGGVAVLSGAVIENGDLPRDYAGDLAATPVYLGCSDTDFHIPKARVERSAEIFRGLNASVTLELFPNFDHAINAQELRAVQAMIASLAAG